MTTALFDCSICISIADQAEVKVVEMEKQQGAKSRLWDCDSCLYDSFELKSFKRQLDSAIASRTLSMPRLSEAAPLPPPPVASIRSSSRISRSLNRLIRSILRLKPGSELVSRAEQRAPDGNHFMHQSTGGVLPTIPERWEQGGDYSSMSPEFDSTVRKTVSERFTGRIAGISCA